MGFFDVDFCQGDPNHELFGFDTGQVLDLVRLEISCDFVVIADDNILKLVRVRLLFMSEPDKASILDVSTFLYVLQS
ncbi:hypothetical protein SCA6_015641 [Theobroma cacao]